VARVNDRTVQVGGESLLGHDPDFVIYARGITSWDDGMPIAEEELAEILDEVVAAAADQGLKFEISWETFDVEAFIERHCRRKGDAVPTAEQASFFAEISACIPELMDWYRRDADGTPWMIVSYDFMAGDLVVATLRLDYDGRNLRGGWSPASVTPDDAARAADRGIDTGLPDGLCVDDVSPEAAAQIATGWFLAHIARWRRAGDDPDGFEPT